MYGDQSGLGITLSSAGDTFSVYIGNSLPRVYSIVVNLGLVRPTFLKNLGSVPLPNQNDQQ